MKLLRADMMLDNDDRKIVFDFDEQPMLMIPVADFEEAQAILDTLERSAARKRAEKPKPPAPAAAIPGASGAAGAGREEPKLDDPPCAMHSDGRHVRTGGAPCACEPANPDALTPKDEGRKRARDIGKKLADKPDLDDATTKTTALPHGVEPGRVA